MSKSEQDRVDTAKVEVLGPMTPPRPPLQDRHATSKRSAKAPDHLGGLTAKQEAFAMAIVQGHSQADAYRMAYDCTNMQDSSIYRQSWEMMRHPKVVARISEVLSYIQEKHRMQAVGLAGFVTEKLLELATSKDSPKHVQLKALESLGRSVGMFTDRKEVKTISDDSLPELEAKLKAKMDALRLVNSPQK